VGLNNILRNATGRLTGGTRATGAAGGRRTTRGVNAAGQAGTRRSGGAGVGGMLRKFLNRR
jgi:hypothetical protein